jgi:hypothetical protein
VAARRPGSHEVSCKFPINGTRRVRSTDSRFGCSKETSQKAPGFEAGKVAYSECYRECRQASKQILRSLQGRIWAPVESGGHLCLGLRSHQTGSFRQGVRQPASSTVAATRLTRTVDSTGAGTAFGYVGDGVSLWRCQAVLMHHITNDLNLLIH